MLEYRTTVYLSHRNFNEYQRKRKENGFNLSQSVNMFLDTQWFGDMPNDLEFELEETKKKLSKITEQRSVLEIRVSDIEKLIETKDIRKDKEVLIFKRFQLNVSNRIENMEKTGYATDYEKLSGVWHHDFFPDNHLSMGLVKDIFHRVQTDSFDFDFFQQLRRGEISGN